jgi:UDP-2-acetamido-2-deoxy-ribo-hexuluronate aminotransferase
MQFVDLAAQLATIRESVDQRIKAVLDHGNFILGPEVKELEKKLADFAGVKNCISCASGTDALLLPLMAYGVGPGDVIFTTPFTFIATAEVISLLGATPIFVDIDPDTFNLDPAMLRQAIDDLKSGKKPTPQFPDGLKPKGIIAVDLFGLPADYDAINAIAREHGLFVIEDAAQSFGAGYKGKMAGSLADVAATSFFPAKPLGCYGDGGAVLTDDDNLADIIESLRVHGKGEHKYDNVRIGINGRLDTLQAAILLAKLEIFSREIEMRQQVAARYSAGLKGSVKVPHVPDGYTSAWAQYSIISDHKKELMGRLQETKIPTAVYYPRPLHLQTAFANLGYAEGSMPVSEQASATIFSLPMHPYLCKEDQDRITACITEFSH